MSRSQIAATFAILLAAVPVSTAPAQGSGSGAAVINDAGFPVKGITKFDTALFKDPDEASESMPFSQFKFVYILPPDKEAPSRKESELEALVENDFYRVARGDSEREFLGWIKQDAVERWDHIQALAFTPKGTRPQVSFFDAQDHLSTYLGSGDASEAAYREPANYGGNLILMPLIKAQTTSVDNEEQDVYQVSFLAGPAGGAPLGEEGAAKPKINGNTSESTYTEAVKNASLDLVFVVDTTNSMSDPIAQVLKSIEAVSLQLKQQKDLPKLRLGLVGYRDKLSGRAMAEMEYVSRVYCDLKQGEDIDTFLREIRGMEVADIGSQDWPEDVWAGVDLALDDNAMHWNQTVAAWKIIILVGDASAHALGAVKNTKNHTPTTILKKAQPDVSTDRGGNPVVFITQHIINDEAADDIEDARDQFEQLTTEATYAGKYMSADVGEDFSAPLTDQILKMLKIQKQVIEDPEAAEAAVGKNVSAAEAPTFIIERLKGLKDAEGEDEAAKLSFSMAYASEFNADGERQFNPYVFVSKGRIQSFKAMLDFLVNALEQAGSPGARNINDIVSQMRILSATLNLGKNITADMGIDELMLAILGFPVKTEIFKLTVRDLAEMGQKDWDRWVAEHREVVRTLETLLANPSIWWALDDGAQPIHHHAFIKLADLP